MGSNYGEVDRWVKCKSTYEGTDKVHLMMAKLSHAQYTQAVKNLSGGKVSEECGYKQLLEEIKDKAIKNLDLALKKLGY